MKTLTASSRPGLAAAKGVFGDVDVEAYICCTLMGK